MSRYKAGWAVSRNDASCRAEHGELRKSGAGEGSRTPTPLRALGFESRSSASSDTPARGEHTPAAGWTGTASARLAPSKTHHAGVDPAQPARSGGPVLLAERAEVSHRAAERGQVQAGWPRRVLRACRMRPPSLDCESMSEVGRAIRVGDALPAVRLKTGSGEEVELAAWRGRPLVVVCVRYYG